jgi:acetyl esterase/lipase
VSWPHARDLRDATRCAFLLASRSLQMQPEPCVLPRSGLSAQVYEPGTETRRTVVFVHGMTHEGPDDPRVVGLASALAATGTRVVVPLLPEVAQARIELESVGRVAAAAADASLRNYLPRCVPLSPAVRELIDLAIREKDITPPVCDSAERLPSEEGRWVDLLLRGAAPDDPMIDMLLDAAGDVTAGLSARLDSCGLQAPVFLLHGEDDRVVPSSESRVLAERLRRAGVDVDLVITPLLSHGNTAIGPRALLHAPTLVRGLARFLGNAGAGRPIHVHHEPAFVPT